MAAHNLQTEWRITVHDRHNIERTFAYPMAATFCRELACSYGTDELRDHLLAHVPEGFRCGPTAHALLKRLYPGTITVDVISQITREDCAPFSSLVALINTYYPSVQILQHDTSFSNGFQVCQARGFRLIGDARAVPAFFWATQLLRDGEYGDIKATTPATEEAQMDLALYSLAAGRGPIDSWYDVYERYMYYPHNILWYQYMLNQGAPLVEELCR